VLDVLYDVFICHASQDKSDLVRPLAEALRTNHVEVWYDEFSLGVGDSLRRSIERGLAQSRFGIVILSPHFFAKEWPQWELNGLVALQNAGPARLILPVWHNVSPDDVLAFSPPLADTVAVSSALGVEEVVRQLLRTIKPQGSTLLIARDELLRRGCAPPVVTDDWWLDVAVASGLHYTVKRWGFILPEAGAQPQDRGIRLAWSAMQMAWQKEADERPITQITPPADVHSFIRSQPGLEEACGSGTKYLIAYAPQLLIRGFGGPFEEKIEALGEDHLIRPATYALRRWAWVGHEEIARQFVQGPDWARVAKFYDNTDYFVWLLSEGSTWLPSKTHDLLTTCMARWAAWSWTGHFQSWLFNEVSDYVPMKSSPAYADLLQRFSSSAALLRLPESGSELVDRLLTNKQLVYHFRHTHLRTRRDTLEDPGV
jgi:hypothetical protein